MKTTISAALMLLCVFLAKAQRALEIEPSALIPGINLKVSKHKTTLLIFPAPIKRVDRGEIYVLAEQVKDVDSILKVKAGEKNFEPSNLSVVTTDGRVYSFNVSYAENAPSLPVNVDKVAAFIPATFRNEALKGKEIEEFALTAAGSKPTLSNHGKSKYGIRLDMEGVYIRKDFLFLRFRLKNHTKIRYESILRFYVRDQKKTKRTAVQDNESIPVYVLRKGVAEEEQGQVVIAVFPKFTIAEKKFFVAEFMEENGDRNPVMRIDQKAILNAKMLYR